ncbi:MAG: hypothetical protein AAF518_06495 [Spirochaetota bacterium]
MNPQPDLDYLVGVLDRLSIFVQRCHKAEDYSPRRRQRYHDTAQEQILYLRDSLEFLLSDWE